MSFSVQQSPKNLLSLVKGKSAEYWKKVSARESLKLFHAAAKRVPAYKDFLAKNGVRPESVRTMADFLALPPMDKDNYLRVYPYDSLLWDGHLRKPLTIHATSGSTGEATYFEREFESDLKREFIIDRFFRYNDLTIEGPSLFIITFGMGVWSAGMGIYTGAYLSIHHNGHPISVITPGVNKIEVMKILRNLAPHYRQVIIAGYPPFVKDVIDEAEEEKIDLRSMNLRFVFTGEAFTEGFRDYLTEHAHIRNPLIDTMNTYGSSELGAMAVETPLSIMVRRQAGSSLFRTLFGDITKIPTLAQYIPYFVNFECIDDELYFTGNNAIPLVKYRSGDHGGLLTVDEVGKAFKQEGIDLVAELKNEGVAAQASDLPLVYVYERKNMATTLYGILIYPEFLKAALIMPHLNKFLTGKFTMQQKYDKNQNQYLEVNVEMRRGVEYDKRFKDAATKQVMETLRARSSEFSELCRNLGRRAYPKLVFWPYEHAQYFTPSSKHRWVIKTNE